MNKQIILYNIIVDEEYVIYIIYSDYIKLNLKSHYDVESKCEYELVKSIEFKNGSSISSLDNLRDILIILNNNKEFQSLILSTYISNYFKDDNYNPIDYLILYMDINPKGVECLSIDMHPITLIYEIIDEYPEFVNDNINNIIRISQNNILWNQGYVINQKEDPDDWANNNKEGGIIFKRNLILYPISHS